MVENKVETAVDEVMLSYGYDRLTDDSVEFLTKHLNDIASGMETNNSAVEKHTVKFAWTNDMLMWGVVQISSSNQNVDGEMGMLVGIYSEGGIILGSVDVASFKGIATSLLAHMEPQCVKEIRRKEE